MQLSETTMALGDTIASEEPVEPEWIRTARRAQIRARLASFMGRDGFVLEQFDIGESGIEGIRVGAPGTGS
jgi:hypothetical protein